MHYTTQNPPVAAEQLTPIMEHMAIHPSAWIIRFWAFSDGAMIEDLIKIYACDEIAERQATYEIAAYFPDHLLVGDDSGGRLILLDRSPSPRAYLLDAGCPSIDDAEVFPSMEALVAAVIAELNETPGD